MGNLIEILKVVIGCLMTVRPNISMEDIRTIRTDIVRYNDKIPGYLTSQDRATLEKALRVAKRSCDRLINGEVLCFKMGIYELTDSLTKLQELLPENKLGCIRTFGLVNEKK